MLNNNNNHSSCKNSDEVVSYLYNDLARADRNKFESHLANCGVCTDEFAAISNARFLVFEWQREEFAHLPTPEIVIPYQIRPVTAETARSGGILSGLLEALSYLSGPRAIPAFGALIVFAGLAIAAFMYLGQKSDQVASNKNPNVVTNIPVDKDGIPASQGKQQDIAKNDEQIDPELNKNGSAQPKPVVKSEKVSSQRILTHPIRTPRQNLYYSRQDAVNDLPEPKITVRSRAPVLSNIGEEDDKKSLRLSDLFDQIGSL